MNDNDQTRDDQDVLCSCTCTCPDCTTLGLVDDGWRYLWIGRSWVGIHRSGRGIALACGRDS